MNIFKSSISFILILTFSGCMTTDSVTTAEINNADFGVYPTDYESIIKKHLHETLIDPSSMMVEFSESPYKGYCRPSTVVDVSDQFGYGVIFRVNAKNRLGGYVGWKNNVAFVRNNRVFWVFETFEIVLGPQYGPHNSVKPIDQIVPRDAKNKIKPVSK